MSTNTIAGSALFSGSESFMGFVQDLSEQDEVVFAGGGGYGKGSKKSSGKKGSGKKGSGYCGCH